jgi:hypothetical protein
MEDLDALKSNPAVLRVYAQYVSLKKTGDKYVGKCPLPEHQDSSPSFTVFSDMRASCFGCGANLNIFQLVQKIDGCDFKTAVAKVKAEVGNTSWSKAKEAVEKTFKPVAEPKTYKTISFDAWKKLEDNLAASEAAKDFLEKERGISLETAQRLRVGFAQNLGALAGAEGADVADKGWVAFPSISDDKVISVKYRSIVAKRFSRQPGMATALFNTEDIDVFEPVYVLEGEFDVAAMSQAGFRAVSLPSASIKLTPEQKDMLMKAPIVLLAGDSDSAGQAAMDRLWKELGNNVYKLTWPDSCKDANDAFRDVCGRDVAKFTALVEELTRKAKSQPLPDIYSLQEVMQSGVDTSLADHPDRLRFPWSEVDSAAILLPGSVLGVMATSTSMGKSALVLQYSLYGARQHNEVVVNWQCELSPSEISTMVAAQVLHKNRNFLTKEDLKEAAERLDGVHYYIGNNSTVNNINEVLDIMEAAIRRTGATMAILDNAHYYTSGVDDDVRVLAAALKRINQMAITYGTKWTVVFQPRKAISQQRGKRTQISDIKGSATAGDTCDAVLAIHRDLVKGAEDGEAKTDIYEEKTLFEWLKTRSKGTGKASAILQFFGEFAEFQALDMCHEPPPE